jgi:hypothetical protein
LQEKLPQKRTFPVLVAKLVHLVEDRCSSIIGQQAIHGGLSPALLLGKKLAFDKNTIRKPECAGRCRIGFWWIEAL